MKNALPESGKPLRVAMIAPPWLKIPVKGYGGLERMVDGLVEKLVKDGVEVEIFGVGDKPLHGAKVHPVTTREEFPSILKPMYDYSLPIPLTHVLKSLELIRRDGNFDVIHDHSYFIGPSLLAFAAGRDGIPPAVHTIHGPPLTSERMIKEGIFDNRLFWEQLGHQESCFFIPISDALKRSMPKEIGKQMLDTVYNAIDVDTFPFVPKEGKKKYFITLAGFARHKGQHIAARVAQKKGLRLRMAGTVATIASPRKLMFEIANPLSKYRSDTDFRYYSDEILPYVLRSPKITYSGSVGGKRKMKLISEARALLFPIQWEEPFGMAVIEALACGTPVIAMNRGAMPEIIKHGVTGFLADTEEEFAEYIDRIDEIDPAACRASVEGMFSDDRMAQRYIDRYREAIARSKGDEPVVEIPEITAKLSPKRRPAAAR